MILNVILWFAAVVVGVLAAAGTLIVALPLTVKADLLQPLTLAAGVLAAAVVIYLLLIRWRKAARRVLYLLSSTALVVVLVLAIWTLMLRPSVGGAPVAITPIGPLSELTWVDFVWQPVELGGQIFERGAIFVPVRINDSEQTVYFQLDTGSPATLLYEGGLPGLTDFSLTVDTAGSPRADLGIVRHVQLALGGQITFTTPELPVLLDYGEPASAEAGSLVPIGSIGADVLREHVLILDYARQRLAIVDTLPETYMQSTAFVDAEMTGSRIKIPLTVGGQTDAYLFDTGASLFAITTARGEWEKMVDTTQGVVEVPGVTTWGTAYTVVGGLPEVPVRLGETELPQRNLYYHPAWVISVLFVQERVRGLVGNEFFYEGTVVIDFLGERFGYFEAAAL
ncbi:MAG: hypothetical protein SF029_00765 [bacterium]|nr:hypothetical protein [bacterium]